MNVDILEKRWIWVVGLIVATMLGSILYTVVRFHAQPPSNIEAIDSTRLHLTREFAEDNLVPKTSPDGSVTVVLVAHRYGFSPPHIELPAGVPITFRVATPDTLHGLHIPGTNIDTMVVPGYVSKLTTTIQYDEVAKYGVRDASGKITVPIYCNEFCGLNHHFMWGEVSVLPGTAAGS